MSRKLLLGTVTYPWPNDGDLDWGQELFDWAQAVTTRVNDLEAGFLNIEDNSIGEVKLKINNEPTIGQYLTFAGSDNFVWADAPSGGGGGGERGPVGPQGPAGPAGPAGPSSLAGVVGGSGITVTHSDSNDKASIAINESIQTQLVPSGGTTGQVLTKQSNSDFALDWTTVSSGATYTAGVGLTLNHLNQFSIGTDQIINSMMQDDSIEQSNIWATANATPGQILSAHTDGTRFVWIDPPSGESGGVADGSVTPAKMDTSNTVGTFDLLVGGSDSQEFAWIPANSLLNIQTNHSLPFNKIERSFNWVDNAGSIDKAVGFESMGLIFKQRTDVGSDNAEWVPTNFSTLFDLQSSTVGTNPSTRQHNYGLKFKPGAIQYQDINAVDDLEQLVAIDFVRAPATVANGNPLRSRLTTPWFTGDALNQDNSTIFTLNSSNVQMTIPRKRTNITRGITHILVKAGRVAGVDNTTTRSQAIGHIQTDANTYHEIVVPVTSAYIVNNNAVARRDGYDRYNVLFADQVSCAIEIRSNLNGTTDIKAEQNNGTTNNYNGTEFLAFYVIRGIGG